MILSKLASPRAALLTLKSVFPWTNLFAKIENWIPVLRTEIRLLNNELYALKQVVIFKEGSITVNMNMCYDQCIMTKDKFIFQLIF